MPIIRGHHSFDDNFTQIPNVWLRDERLSYKARGVLAELMSHRPGWQVSVASMSTRGRDGKDAIKAAIKELEHVGYLTREQLRTDGNRFGETNWVTREPWVDIPSTEKPTTEIPTTDNPTPKKTITKEEQVNKTNEVKATRLVEDWMPSNELLSWANDKHPNVNVELETANFVDYWVSKPSNATKLDWGRTWQQWIRTCASRMPSRRTGEVKQTNLQKNMSLVQRIAEKELGRLEIER